jgi:hypothetical protein
MEKDLFGYLKPRLKVCYLTANKKDIIIRCPYCGDSRKDPRKGHFYILNRSPYKFHCFKCETKGYMNSEVLNKINVTDYSLVSMINKNLDDYKKKLTYKYGTSLIDLNRRELNLYPNQYTQMENGKIQYLNNRLGVEMVESDVDKYRLILNMKDFLTNNEMKMENYTKTKRDQKLLSLIQDYTIGFLTSDKSTIICRSLNPERTGFRYHNFALFPEDLDSKIFYSIKKKLDLSLLEHKIIVTEGIIDIIGVYNHVTNKDDNPLYVANNGKNFNHVFDYISRLSLLNADIEIYSDKDVNLDYYQKLVQYNRLAKFNGVRVFYNQIGKDYGVKKSEILLNNGSNVIG